VGEEPTLSERGRVFRIGSVGVQRVSVPAHIYLRSDVYTGIMLELGKVGWNEFHEMSPCTRQTKPGRKHVQT
jgi:hypothetical protein